MTPARRTSDEIVPVILAAGKSTQAHCWKGKPRLWLWRRGFSGHACLRQRRGDAQRGSPALRAFVDLLSLAG